MRKITLLLAGGLISTMSMAQITWSEDFDSYTVGDYMGVVGAADGWTTWSGTTGGAEDVQVTDANSQSGSNSVYFEAGNGQDVVLEFGDEYNTGHFQLDMAIYSDSGFYINLQGEEPIGTTWAYQMYVIDDSLGIDDASALYYNEAYTDQGQWNELSIDIDLDNNVWTTLWNGDTLASFENLSINQVASLNIYPLGASTAGATHSFYIDDMSWSWTPTPNLITFQLDMNYYTGAFTTPEVNGTFNGWCGNCNPMTDTDGDNVWEATLPIQGDSIEYKYSYDNWSGQEELTAGLSCTKTTGEFTNRFLVMTGDMTLDVVCWEQCDTCSIPTGVAEMAVEGPAIYPNPTNDVLNIDFGSEVKDMAISVYDLTGRQVVRAFNNFNGTKAIIDVTSLPQGVYTVVGSSDELRFTESVIIAQ